MLLYQLQYIYSDIYITYTVFATVQTSFKKDGFSIFEDWTN
jgi:hypothetical protein